MNFDESLPESCPPADCESRSLEAAYRMLVGENPCEQDWLSHLQLGKPCHSGVDLCRWGSLSLLLTFPAVQKLAKLPNFREATHAALLTVPSKAGVHKVSKNHIDFWQDNAANMNDFVKSIEPIRSA